MQLAHLTPPKLAWGSHGQTIYPALFPGRKSPQYHSEKLLETGSSYYHYKVADPIGTAILIPGMEGGVSSSYIVETLKNLIGSRIECILLNHRSFRKTVEKVQFGYHAGYVDCLKQCITQTRDQLPHSPLHVVGFSLGATVAVNLVAKDQAIADKINTLTCISMAYDLAETANLAKIVSNRLYEGRVLKSLIRKLDSNPWLWNDNYLERSAIRQFKHVEDYDREILVPLFGFRSIQEYYQECSARHLLAMIEVPTLLINAINDPVVGWLPEKQHLSKATKLLVTDKGGHLGFSQKGRPSFYAEQLVDYLNRY